MSALYRVILEPQSPLMISGPTMGNYRTTLDYIPGSTLRGALAQKLARGSGQAAYESIFESSEPPIFFDLLPTGVMGGKFPRRIPPTALSCKRYPGFRHDRPGESPRHGIMDSLIAGYVAQRKEQEFLPLCPTCEAELQSYKGYYAGQQDTGDYIIHQATTHVGIGRRRSTAEDSFLYTRVGLNSAIDQQDDLAFVGLALLSERAYQELNSILQTPLWIGGNRSRGMGKAQVRLSAYKPEAVKTRVQNFNAKVLDALEEHSVNVDGAYFCLDALWVPSSLYITQTSPPLNLNRGEELVYQVVRTEVQAGWHAVAGIPRRGYTVVFGTYLYRVPQLDDPLIAALETLEVSPIGTEIERGYGLVRVCDTFHDKDTVL